MNLQCDKKGQGPQCIYFLYQNALISYVCSLFIENEAHLQNSLEGGRDGVLTGVVAVRVLIRRKTGCLRCLRWARELAASGVFFQ